MTDGIPGPIGHEGAPGPRGPRSFLDLPLKAAKHPRQYVGYHCCFCNEPFQQDQLYYDGGDVNSRAHAFCVEQAIAVNGHSRFQAKKP